MTLPDPQDSTSPLYTFTNEQPESAFPNNLDSSPSNYTTRQLTPEAITATFPIVVTITAHGLSNGDTVRATKFIRNPPALATGMEQLNNQQYTVQQATDDTFQLYQNNLPVDGTGYTTYVSGGQLTATSVHLVVNPSVYPS